MWKINRWKYMYHVKKKSCEKFVKLNVQIYRYIFFKITRIFLMPQSSHVNNHMIHNHTNNKILFFFIKPPAFQINGHYYIIKQTLFGLFVSSVNVIIIRWLPSIYIYFIQMFVKDYLRNLGSCSLSADSVVFRTQLLKWRTSHVIPHCQSIAVRFRLIVKEEPGWVFWSLEMNKLVSFTTKSRLQDEWTKKHLATKMHHRKTPYLTFGVKM